ncbi:MAG: PQQ-dependent sugar dehydrogenase [Aureliella sp.]
MDRNSGSRSPLWRSLVSLALICLGVAQDSALLAERIPWETSRIRGSAEPPKPYRLEPAYPNLQFRNPVELVALPGSNLMLLLQVNGQIFLFEDDVACENATLIHDIAANVDNFGRSFSIQPHPKFAENGFVYICYADKEVAKPDGTRLSRFRLQLKEQASGHGGVLQEETVLLTWASGGHNGCAIRFDNQGKMYFSAGDGARPFPPDEYDVGQDLTDLRSTICRIDVDQPAGRLPYSVPSDNPFVGQESIRPEIWAYGFRNPWRFAIDPETQRLCVGDVGWELWELVFNVERGGNYGWSIFEGPQPIRNDIQPGPTPIQRPIVAYPHTQGLSVTGGVFYRGRKHPELDGKFLYGDYVTGLLWAVEVDERGEPSPEALAETGIPIISFALDKTGEVLVMAYSGAIHRLVANNEHELSQEAFPQRLSETGLFASLESLEPNDGVYRYGVTTTAYQDGAQSNFAVALPGKSSIKTNKMKRNWNFPVDTVFVKTLSREIWVDGVFKQQRIETQILHRNGLAWQPLCYVWNADQSDALLAPAEGANSTYLIAGRTGEPEEWNWRHHSRSECRACHTQQSGGAVGFSFENLSWVDEPSRAHEPAAVGKKLLDLQLVDKLPAKNWNVSQMVAPEDPTQSLEARARSYLHANCAHCHCRGGGGTVALDLVYSNPTNQINAINYEVTQGAFGIENPKVIAAGDPYSSLLYYRMATSGTGHMPKLWDRDNDEGGLRLIHDWIASLSTGDGASASPVSTGQASSVTPVALRHVHELFELEGAEQQKKALGYFKDADALTVGLFERFIPKEDRTERLGSRFDAASILAMQGDAETGRQRFLQGKVQQCRNCHRLEGQGLMVGPDLDGIGTKRTKSQLLEAIVNPSQDVSAEYATHSVVTLDGDVVSGLLLSEQDGDLKLRSADGKTYEIASEEIEYQTKQTSSLMPDGLTAQMTAQELADLLAFLAGLKDGSQ